MLPPLVLASALGLRGAAAKLIVPMGLSQGGNTIVLGGEAIKESEGLPPGARLVAWLAGQSGRPRIAVVHRYSTHNLLLRYWLALTGVDPDRDIETVVVPPEQVVPALASGQIAGFCAGAPWGMAARTGRRRQRAAGYVRHLAVSPGEMPRGPWRTGRSPIPDALTRLLRTLMRAQVVCDQPEAADEVVAAIGGRGRAGVAARGGAGRVARRLGPRANPFPRCRCRVSRAAARDLVSAADAPLGVAERRDQPRRHGAGGVSTGSFLFGRTDGRFVRSTRPLAQHRGSRDCLGRFRNGNRHFANVEPAIIIHLIACNSDSCA